MHETKPIVSQFAEVVAEHLFVQIAEEVEGFDAHIGSLDSALAQAPEVFESVGGNLPVNVKSQLFSFHGIAHSLTKTPGVGYPCTFGNGTGLNN